MQHEQEYVFRDLEAPTVSKAPDPLPVDDSTDNLVETENNQKVTQLTEMNLSDPYDSVEFDTMTPTQQIQHPSQPTSIPCQQPVINSYINSIRDFGQRSNKLLPSNNPLVGFSCNNNNIRSESPQDSLGDGNSFKTSKRKTDAENQIQKKVNSNMHLSTLTIGLLENTTDSKVCFRRSQKSSKKSSSYIFVVSVTINGVTINDFPKVIGKATGKEYIRVRRETMNKLIEILQNNKINLEWDPPNGRRLEPRVISINDKKVR